MVAQEKCRFNNYEDAVLLKKNIVSTYFVVDFSHVKFRKAFKKQNIKQNLRKIFKKIFNTEISHFFRSKNYTAVCKK